MEMDGKALMGSPHVQHLDTAFLQLSFALKLWNFFKEHGVDKEKFDIELTLEGQDSRICLAQNEFNSEDDIIFASENNISICFGVAAITLWEAIRECGVISKNIPKPIETEQDKLAALSYMIRCCFAHGSARPRWEIRDDKYKIVYQVGNKEIDLRNLNDTEFSYQSIGGC